jgi:hypothetical protein
MTNKIIKIIAVFFMFFEVGYAQYFHVNDSIIQITRNLYEKDSLLFNERLDKFMQAETKDELEDACSRLDEFKYKKWIKANSDKIIKKVSNQYEKCGGHCRDLLSFTNASHLPDSIRNEFLTGNDKLRKARLGDSVAIQSYIDKYTLEKQNNGDNFDPGGLSYWLKWLLSFDSKMALDVVFSDIQSTRIIKRCERILDDYPCFNEYYTYPYSIINALISTHKNEAIFNRIFIFPYVLVPKEYTKTNPYIPEYFKLVEEFILREYGYEVKINVPYLRAYEK